MTISNGYLEQQKRLHQNPNYGSASQYFGPLVLQWAEKIGAKSISDYGAGKCKLQKTMNELGWSDFQYYPYDPVFPEYGAPKEADIVCCLDVLEHVEPPYLDAVLQGLCKITVNVGLFSIDTGPAIKHLSDGRNAHLIQKPASWWMPELCQYFEISHLQRCEGGFWVAVEPLASS